jgi:hypothetical protein
MRASVSHSRVLPVPVEPTSRMLLLAELDGFAGRLAELLVVRSRRRRRGSSSPRPGRHVLVELPALPDLSRRCPAADPDDHHLFVSIGCATENLVQAALANGLNGNVVFDDSAGKALRVMLEPTKAVATRLFDAIPERQSTRAEYDGKPISTSELALLERAATGNGVRIILLTGREAMEKVLEYVVQGNTAQMNDRLSSRN